MKKLYYILFYSFLSIFAVSLYGCQDEGLDDDEEGEPVFPSGRKLLEVKVESQKVVTTFTLDTCDVLKTDTTKTKEFLLYRFTWTDNLVTSYDEFDEKGSKSLSCSYKYDGKKLIHISGTMYNGTGSSVPFSYDVKNDADGRISSFEMPLGPNVKGSSKWNIVYGSNDRIAEMSGTDQSPFLYKLTWDNFDITKLEMYRNDSTGNMVLSRIYEYEYCKFKSPFANMNLLCPILSFSKSENCVISAKMMVDGDEMYAAHTYDSYGGYPENELRVTARGYRTDKNYIMEKTTSRYIYKYVE